MHDAGWMRGCTYFSAPSSETVWQTSNSGKLGIIARVQTKIDFHLSCNQVQIQPLTTRSARTEVGKFNSNISTSLDCGSSSLYVESHNIPATMNFRTYISIVFLFAVSAFAQITIPATNGSLPAAGANGCAAGYFPGSDTVLYTVPYTYTQVLSIIGNYTNLTWSGSPENSVTSNSTNWVPGTARFYDIAGAHVIETITTYSKPAAGPYVEIHTVAPLSVPSYNVSFYSDYDAQLWTPICGGMATTTNFTINFCATNATVAAAVLHSLHSSDAMTVGTFLGGMNFTSCAAINGSSSSSGNGSATMSGAPTMFTGAATRSSSIGGARWLVGAVLLSIVIAL
jgi:hypothetical protein